MDDTDVNAFDRANHIKTASPVAKKEEFGYVQEKTNPQCGTCNMYLLGGGCTIVKGKIDPQDGACNFWAYRRTKPPKEPYDPDYTKNESGYVEYPNGPRCGVCEYYKNPRRCSKVMGDIDPIHGCCIRWEEKK